MSVRRPAIADALFSSRRIIDQTFLVTVHPDSDGEPLAGESSTSAAREGAGTAMRTPAEASVAAGSEGRTLASRRRQEFYPLLDTGGMSDDINEKLREWEDYYNYHRPHGALNGQTPYERLVAKTRADVLPKI